MHFVDETDGHVDADALEALRIAQRKPFLLAILHQDLEGQRPAARRRDQRAILDDVARFAKQRQPPVAFRTIGATALTSTSASAKFLNSTHFSGSSRPNTGAVQGTDVFTPGLPGSSGNFAPSYPSDGRGPSKPGVCGTHPGQCG